MFLFEFSIYGALLSAITTPNFSLISKNGWFMVFFLLNSSGHLGLKSKTFWIKWSRLFFFKTWTLWACDISEVLKSCWTLSTSGAWTQATSSLVHVLLCVNSPVLLLFMLPVDHLSHSKETCTITPSDTFAWRTCICQGLRHSVSLILPFELFFFSWACILATFLLRWLFCF